MNYLVKKLKLKFNLRKYKNLISFKLCSLKPLYIVIQNLNNILKNNNNINKRLWIYKII